MSDARDDVTPRELTPTEVVSALDEHIVGQGDAKRAVAIALRNRWRWRQLAPEMRREVTPKNILMIGPTGVGKTEITRRLARITQAPFVKVEATKYTEVGYYGRDVESIIRDLVDASITLVKQRRRGEVEEQAKQAAEEVILRELCPAPEWDPDPERQAANETRHEGTKESLRKMLHAGQLDAREVPVNFEKQQVPMHVFSNMGLDQMDTDFQNMFEKVIPKSKSQKKLAIKDAWPILIEQEVERLMDSDAIHEEARRLAEDSGIVFIDEIDKVCGAEEGKSADVSRQGVQRDLLPLVEGTTVQTRHGSLKTDHMLFIAAGAFHRSRPADLMPELQGRFPIRVELQDLTEADFVRILKEPSSSLTRQYEALLATDGVTLTFTDDGIDELARVAFHVNQSTQNIGARRLHTILERLLEEISFAAPHDEPTTVTIDREYVRGRLEDVTTDEDLSRFIL